MNKKLIVFFIYLLLFGLILSLAILIYSGTSKELKIYNANALNLIDQRMKGVFLEINNFPGSAADDILFLSRLSGFNNLVSSEGTISEKKSIENDFLAFLKQSSAYYQVRYINELGKEIFRVDFDGQEYKVIKPSELQDKQYRYYFNQTMSLAKGEVFISRLDLNVEDGMIENRGTERNPKYVPVIRYATPVFNSQDEHQGIVIVNVYADYFLEDIERSQKEREVTFLINNNGYYLAHPQKEKEFAFMFDDKGDNFSKDYPKVADGIIENCQERRTETEDFIFTYRCIHPMSSSFEVHEGSQKLFANNGDGYYWILITVTNKDEVQKTFKDFKSRYLWLTLLFFLITLIIIILVVLLTKLPRAKRVKKRRKRNKKILIFK